jgi:hypothetical protein
MQEPATTLNLTAVVTPDEDWFMAAASKFRS